MTWDHMCMAESIPGPAQMAAETQLKPKAFGQSRAREGLLAPLPH